MLNEGAINLRQKIKKRNNGKVNRLNKGAIDLRQKDVRRNNRKLNRLEGIAQQGCYQFKTKGQNGKQ